MWGLLTPPKDRPQTFHIGSTVYDQKEMGYVDRGKFVYDTSLPGNSNAGHDYGTHLAEPEKRHLIQYLKTR